MPWIEGNVGPSSLENGQDRYNKPMGSLQTDSHRCLGGYSAVQQIAGKTIGPGVDLIIRKVNALVDYGHGVRDGWRHTIRSDGGGIIRRSAAG